MKNNIFDLSGQVARVAGGSSGLGLQFAKAMANAGANVAIVARRTDSLEKNAKEIAEERGIVEVALSLSLTSGLAVANAMTITADARPKPKESKQDSKALIAQSFRVARSVLDELDTVQLAELTAVDAPDVPAEQEQADETHSEH